MSNANSNAPSEEIMRSSSERPKDEAEDKDEDNEAQVAVSDYNCVEQLIIIEE